jgi:hypothetical protein
MPPKKFTPSALSAALRSPGPAEEPALPPAPKKSVLDPVAFPCLYQDGQDVEASAQSAADALEDLDLAAFVPVGSAPTNILRNGVPMVSVPAERDPASGVRWGGVGPVIT